MSQKMCFRATASFFLEKIHKSLKGFGFSIGSIVLPLFGRWRVSSDAGSVSMRSKSIYTPQNSIASKGGCCSNDLLLNISAIKKQLGSGARAKFGFPEAE